MAYVLFSSGTTSDPKGVMTSHGNLLAHIQTLSKVYDLSPAARALNILMLYHVDGIIQGPLLTFYNQATWIRPMRFDLSRIEEIFHCIYKYKISHFYSVPTILSFMNRFSEGYEDSFQTADFKFISSSASKLEEKLWQEFEQKFKVQLTNVYGLTETVCGSLYCGINGLPRKTGTIGVPIDCEAKIVKADGSLAKENEEGNLWLKGAHIFPGYFKNPEANAAVLKDGWLNTGDVAVKDPDGFFSITGRTKSMVNVGGANIYPEQVSEMINTHPKVLENICLGVSDENFSEKLVSAIVPKPNESLDKIELTAFLRPLLKQNQIPKELFFFEDLPKGLAGKVQINAVKDLIKSINSNKSGPLNESYKTNIKETAAEAFGLAPTSITMDDTAQTLEGWDSMAHLVFISELEKHYHIRFSTAEMMTMTSLKTTERILRQKLNAK